MKKRADGRWAKKKVIGGKSVWFYSTKATEKQAVKDIENQMIEYQQKLEFDTHNFKALADQAIERQSFGIGHSTLQGYIYALKRLSCFYDYNIEDITCDMVQDRLDCMARKEKYSFSAVNKTKITFGIILDYATGVKQLPINNYKKLLKVPKAAKKGKVTSPPDEVRNIIIQNADKVEFGMWAMIFICAGLRRGELAGLQKKKINFAKNEIMIDQSVEFISNQPHLKDTPKTEASIDSVPILPILKPHLVKLCEGLEPDDFIFGGKKPLTVSAIRRRWEKYCKTIGHDFKGHQLRHAFAKILHESNVDPKTAQRLLRHANFQTTMDIYTDFSETLTNEALNNINTFVSKAGENS